MDGQAVLWVVLPGLPPPAIAATSDDPQDPPEQPPPPSPPSQPIDLRLHARQMAIGAVKINGVDADFSYPAPPVDLLKNMVPPAATAAPAAAVGGDLERSGEALDLHYRCRFLAAQDGELGLQLPPGEGWHAERDREEGEVVPKAVLNALSAGNRVSARSCVYYTAILHFFCQMELVD